MSDLPPHQRAAGHGRLSAASGAPGPDVPLATTAGAPGHDRLSAVQQAPGPDVPLATTARAPRHDRLSAAHLVPDHNRSGAALAAASVPDRSPVSPPPVSAHDRSRHAPVAAGSPPASVTHPATLEETLYDRLFTADEVQALMQAATAPVLDGEIRVLQVLIRRILALGPARARPRGRRRGGVGRRRPRAVLFRQIAAIGRACDVLQRMLKAQQALAKDSPSELYQLLDEAAKYMEDPSLASRRPGRGPRDRGVRARLAPYLTKQPPPSPRMAGGHRGARIIERRWTSPLSIWWRGGRGVRPTRADSPSLPAGG